MTLLHNRFNDQEALNCAADLYEVFERYGLHHDYAVTAREDGEGWHEVVIYRREEGPPDGS